MGISLNQGKAISKRPSELVSTSIEEPAYNGPRPVILTQETPSDSVKPAEKKHLQSRAYVGKRMLDIVGATLISLALLPVIAVIALVIRGRGSQVIFAHERIGRHGHRFRCYKFQTMVPDAEHALRQILENDPGRAREWRDNHKLQNDPRVTRFGRFLRKSSLDELPQLLNVLRGDMSLVGPRPVVADELDRYAKYKHLYLAVKPGMTGLWQVLGRSNIDYAERVRMDAYYVRNQCLKLDLWIGLRTTWVVLHRAGAV